jgi:hypothetical protein
MVETISPVVHGGRRSRYLVTVAAHVAGAALAAALAGAGLGGIGALLGAPWGAGGPILVAAVAALYGLREAVGAPLPVPAGRRQVPDWWRTFFSPPVAAFLYGAGLGIGFLTFLSFGTYVAVAAAALATGHPLVAAGLCLPFGIARGLSVLVASGSTSAPRAAAVVDRLQELAATPVPGIVNAGALAALAVAATLAV